MHRHERLGRWAAFLLWGTLTLTPLTIDAAGDDAMTFVPGQYTERTINASGQTIACRAYEGLVYVEHPVDANYQKMNIYIPQAYFEGGTINGYDAETAPVFMPNMIEGYMPGRPASLGNSGGGGMKGGPGGAGGLDRMATPGGPGSESPGGPPQAMNGGPGGMRGGGGGMPGGPGGGGQGGQSSALTQALAHGCVVASPGARGRTLQGAGGQYTGKAPAAIVDLKAAVRYLRFNDAAMPGDASKIISNGTGAGGALSALLGATGDSPDYDPALAALGAAEASDAIFAASCYCPVTDLDHADMAYEWVFNGINRFNGRGGAGVMNAKQTEYSDQLKAHFTGYVNSLGLTAPDGRELTLGPDGGGPFKDYVESFIAASAQKALDAGQDLSKLSFIKIKDGRVRDLDLRSFAVYATRVKTAPAFDALDLSSPENNLFGTAKVNNQHFTEYGRANSADHTEADAAIIKMMNPMPYIGAEGVATAAHWRIRHGAADRDTAWPVPVILATKLENAGVQVDLAFPWAQGHGGDYDLDELFDWIDGICATE